MSEKRRQYTAEFKREAVGLVTHQGYGVTEAARNLGSHANLVGRWKRQAERHTKGSVAGNGHLSAEHDELLELRQEVKRLRMEREILTKAALLFAPESSCKTPALRSPRRTGRSQCCGRGWGLVVADLMTPKGVRLPLGSVAKRSPCLSGSRRSRHRRITGTAVVA